MSLYNADYIKSFYDEYGEQETFRWEKSLIQKVKFAIHEHYLHKYIQKEDLVLELGAGSGMFTNVLMKLTNHLIVSDISSVQLNLNKTYAEAQGYISQVKDWKLLDICDLSEFEPNSIDKIVCYGGPLSYVFDQNQLALKEIYRILKPGGICCLSVMNLWGTVREYLTKIMLETSPEENDKVLKTGNLHPSSFAPSAHYCHMFRWSELEQIFKDANFKILGASASNSISPLNEEELKSIYDQPKKWNYMIEMEIQSSCSPGMLESGTHLIAVIQK